MAKRRKHKEIQEEQKYSSCEKYPVIAGVLLFISSAVDLVYAGWRAGEWGYDICLSLFVILGIIAIIGGIAAVQRRSYYVAVIGAIAGICSIGFYGTSSIPSVIALILLLKSRSEFK